MAEEAGDELSRVGPRLRILRKRAGLSLTQLSDKAGISIGMLSQIERGVSSPSLRSLQRLGQALGVPLAWFFEERDADEGEAQLVVRHYARPSIDFAARGVVKELLSPLAADTLEIMIVAIRPGGSSGEEPYHHEGEEAGLVLEGRLELWVGERQLLLEAGDAFQFASPTPHRFLNPGHCLTRVLWAVTPPFYGSRAGQPGPSG